MGPSHAAESSWHQAGINKHVLKKKQKHPKISKCQTPHSCPTARWAPSPFLVPQISCPTLALDCKTKKLRFTHFYFNHRPYQVPSTKSMVAVRGEAEEEDLGGG